MGNFREVKVLTALFRFNGPSLFKNSVFEPYAHLSPREAITFGRPWRQSPLVVIVKIGSANTLHAYSRILKENLS